MSEAPQFGHEKLDVYRVSIDFVIWVGDLLDGPLKKSGLSAVNQLDRASTSISLLRSLRRATEGRLLDIANGSALECAAALDVLVARKALPREGTLPGKMLLVRIVGMLTKMTLKILGPDAYR